MRRQIHQRKTSWPPTSANSRISTSPSREDGEPRRGESKDDETRACFWSAYQRRPPLSWLPLSARHVRETTLHSGTHAIVASERFILATRDTGYRSVGAAVAELVDNALQADSKRIDIRVDDVDTAEGRSITLGVVDDGHGMGRDILQAALQFGGSTRFGQRSGLGRFGMGLPNSSVSQTRRVDVYSWQHRGPVLATYLDIDEVASGQLSSIPDPLERPLPAWASQYAAASGTLVEWTRCDRLGRLRAATVAQRLRDLLGRLYRFAIWRGVRINVNDRRLSAIDPLFLHPKSQISGAERYGSPMRYEFTAPIGGTGQIEVRFSELPVATWREWPDDQKRRAGIVGRGGVSIVRADREIDSGWYLMGSKRRENYDDWWRCEVRFSPELDELFGVTHSKQGITPTAELRTVVEPELEAIARDLNRRVRTAFERAKQSVPSRATAAARRTDRFLPVPEGPRRRPSAAGFRYRIQIESLSTPDFFRAELVRDTLLITLNRDHPFVATVYLPIADKDSRERFNIESMIFGAARADLEATTRQQQQFLLRVRRSWADALAVFVES